MTALAARARVAVRIAPARSLALELTAFGALLALATNRWAALFAVRPHGSAWALVGMGLALGAGLALSPRLGRGRARVARVALVGVAVALAPRTAGVPWTVVSPAHWGELVDGIGQGLIGLQSVRWPFRAGGDWITVTLQLMPALATVVASALAFWPGRALGVRRAAALAAVLTLYGYGVVSRPPAGQAFLGLFLIGLVAAFLWLPGVVPARRSAAWAALLAMTTLALPVGAIVSGGGAWVDYRSWRPFSSVRTTSFDFEHQYGPIDWSRTGVELLRIHSSRPLYWKMQTLDRFDGVGWEASPFSLRQPDLDRPPGTPARWEQRYTVDVRALRSDQVVVAGTGLDVEARDEPISNLARGSLHFLDTPGDGTRYSVRVYAPEPTAAQLRAAPEAVDRRLGRYTIVEQPGAAAPAFFPLRGEYEPAADTVAHNALDPGYAAVYRIARRVTAGAPTAYDAARRIEVWLRREARYDERPPRRALPLVDFILRDRIGYCQYFAGAMALMLRMDGIPARVAGGFAPGRALGATTWKVRDEDAHSWVEVWFAGIGWVVFDPTPPATPALGLRPDPAADASTAGAGPFGDPGDSVAPADPGQRGRQAERPELQDSGSARGLGSGGSDPVPWGLVSAALGVVAVACAGLVLHRRRRHRRPRPRDPGEAAVLELYDALARLGQPVAAGTTLRVLEGRLARTAGPGAAAYARALGDARFAPGGRLPGRATRRALRRALARRAGPVRRVRVLMALPPRLRSAAR